MLVSWRVYVIHNLKLSAWWGYRQSPQAQAPRVSIQVILDCWLVIVDMVYSQLGTKFSGSFFGRKLELTKAAVIHV